jgi:RNA-directed DNA polymerase
MRALLLVRVLAGSFLAGSFALDDIVARASHILGRERRWLRPLAKRFLKKFSGHTRPRHRDVVLFLRQDEPFQNILLKHGRGLHIAQWLTGPQQMQPVEAARIWPVPPIESIADLADWFGLTPFELDWYADLKNLNYKKHAGKLRHYHYRILAKQSGNLRLIESPKPILKVLQRRILKEILEKIPAHDSAHGFIKGRSIKTFALPHVNRRVVLKMDLQDFFPSISAARIQAFFRTVGYPEPVSDRLAGICTTTTPRDIWTRSAFGEDPLHLWESRGEAYALYHRSHLPQGAPTSPALANFCAYRLDCRLAGLAESAGALYTRYADDLAFSGDAEFEKRAARLSAHVAAIALEEGLKVHHRKTRIMRSGVRQRLAGLIVNAHPNIPRNDFDRLKAELTNCVRLGPASQNRESHPDFRQHLEGRVGFVETINPPKGKRLRAIFDQIQWT